jgi:hypothetical protein
VPEPLHQGLIPSALLTVLRPSAGRRGVFPEVRFPVWDDRACVFCSSSGIVPDQRDLYKLEVE